MRTHAGRLARAHAEDELVGSHSQVGGCGGRCTGEELSGSGGRRRERQRLPSIACGGAAVGDPCRALALRRKRQSRRIGPHMCLSVDRLRGLLLRSKFWAHLGITPPMAGDEDGDGGPEARADDDAGTGADGARGDGGRAAKQQRVRRPYRRGRQGSWRSAGGAVGLGVSLGPPALSVSESKAVQRAGMDLALLQIITAGNDYLDRVGGLPLEPTIGAFMVMRITLCS